MRPLALGILLSTAAIAQVSDKVLSVRTSAAREGQPLTIEAELVRTAQINQVLLAYRRFGASEYRQMEMAITGNRASATVPANEVIPPQVEYYLILKIQEKTDDETYPIENPLANPFRIQIAARPAKDAEVLVLSPEQVSTVSTEELLISVSLLRASSAVEKSATKVFIDDRDVTKFTVISEELITLVPENVDPPIKEGSHVIRVELYDTAKALYHSTSVTYRQISASESEEIKSVLTYTVSATLEARNETIQNTSTPYNRGNLLASSEYGLLRLNGRLYVTNEEKSERQPQNRYFLEALTPWVRAGYGDAYPVFPSLVMSGKRLRGLTANLTLGVFNLDLATGEVIRKIDGDTLRTLSRTSVAGQSGAIAFYDTTDTNRYWAEFRYGTFPRSLFVIRPSLGFGKNVQLGFSYLKAKDDVDALRRNGVLYGSKPQENIAFGSDLLVALDDQRFEFTAQGAASVYNQDIAEGDISDARIDSLYRYPTNPTQEQIDSVDNKRQDLRDIRKRISRFITVNQNLVPLSLDKLSTILAYEGAIALNYFNNYFKASYIFRGSEYNSFGQTFIRKDIQGFNVFDRIRFLENQLFLSFSLERLQDNTSNQKIATTTFLNVNTTVSYFPRADFPSFTVGYGQNSSSNGLPTFPDSSLFAIEDITHRWFVQVGYDFTYLFRHNATLSVSTASRDDETRRNSDTKSMTISGSVTTTWNIPLETSASVTLNLNQLPRPDPADPSVTTLSPFNYTTIFLSGRYRVIEDKLRVWAALAPTLGDVQRTNLDVGGEYFFYKNLSGLLQMSLYQNPGVTDFIWSLMVKYNL